MMKLIGILLLLNSLALAAWWITMRGTYEKSVIGLAGLAVAASITLILFDRITEFSWAGATIKTTVEQAQSDADVIARIKKDVENQSATIHLVAQEATSAKALSEEVDSKIVTAEGKLEMLDAAIAKANSTLSELESTSEFMKTVVAAQNDDRRAFDRLEALSKDKTNPYCDEAQNAWTTIFESHSLGLFSSDLVFPWKEGLDPSKLSLAELHHAFQGIQPGLKPALIEYIWKRDDIPNIERLDFLMAVMKGDESLTAVEYAGRYFTKGTGQKIKPLALAHLSAWWQEHREEFVAK